MHQRGPVLFQHGGGRALPVGGWGGVLKMAAESQHAGSEPSPGRRRPSAAVGWLRLDGGGSLGRKRISERHNGSLRRVGGVVFEPRLRRPGCSTHLCPAVRAAAGAPALGSFLIAAAFSPPHPPAPRPHPSKNRINLRRRAVVVFCHALPVVELFLRLLLP